MRTKYIFILFMLIVIQMPVIAQASEFFDRGVWMVFGDRSNMRTLIDEVYFAHGDAIFIATNKEKIHNSIDIANIDDAISYAHTKNIKFILVFSWRSYTTPDGTAGQYLTTLSLQEEVMNDFNWLLQRYPTLDGIYLEEYYPYYTLEYNAWRSLLVQHFAWMKDNITKYHDFNDGSFAFIGGTSSLEAQGNYEEGQDIAYYNENRLFNMWDIQLTRNTYNEYVNYSIIWINKTNNMETILTTFVQWGDWFNFNQQFFNQLKYANNQSLTQLIYHQNHFYVNANVYFPNDHTPGTTVIDRIRYIWGMNITSYVSNPEFSPIAGTYTSNQTIYITSGTSNATIRYTLDGSNPIESSTLYTTPLNISSTTTIKVRAYKAGYANSFIVTAQYNFQEPYPPDSDDVDNNLKKNSPTSVFNTRTYLEDGCINPCTSSIYRSLLRINISGWTIDDAPFTLRLKWYDRQNTSLPWTTQIEIYKPWKNWRTNYTTWNNYNLSSPWTNAGGDWVDADGTLQGTVPYDSVLIPSGNPNNQYYDFNVTQIVLDAINEGSTNVSFMIKASNLNESESDNYVMFHGLDTLDGNNTPILNSSEYIEPNPPQITSWGNNYTNNNSLSFSLPLSLPIVIKFNTTSDQAVDWVWYVDNINQNNNFDNLTVEWSSGGVKYIEARPTNSNGIDVIQWVVYIISSYTPSIPVNIDVVSKRTYLNISWESGSGNISDNYNINIFIVDEDGDIQNVYQNTTSNLYWNQTLLSDDLWYFANISIQAVNNTNAYSNFSDILHIQIPEESVHGTGWTNQSYNFTGVASGNYTIRIRAKNNTFNEYSAWSESTVNVNALEIVDYTKAIFMWWD